MMKTADNFDSWAHVIEHVNRLEAALLRIGNNNSGHWGEIARAALYPAPDPRGLMKGPR